MNTTPTGSFRHGFTLVELLMVMAIISIIAALLLPTLGRGRTQAQRISCVNNLRQIGIAFHSFAHEHKNRFSMRVPESEGGSMIELGTNDEPASAFQPAYRHFLPLSNMLVTPKMLHCPSDLLLPARNFGELRDRNLSYFAALNAQFGKTTMILSGDRNITLANSGPQFIYYAGTNNLIHWTTEMHHWKGNLLFADGHVERADGLRLVSSGKLQFAVAEVVVPDPSSPIPGTVAQQPQVTSGADQRSPQVPAMEDAQRSPINIGSSSSIQIVSRSHGTVQTSSADQQNTTGSTPTGAVSSVSALESSAIDPDDESAAETESYGPLIQRGRYWLWLLLILLVVAVLYRLLRLRTREPMDEETEDEEDM